MEILRAITPHDNIVRLQYFAMEADLAEDNTRLLTLFMDYLPSNLQFVMQENATGMSLSLVQTYAKQLLSGLSHLASLNIVHRDLLPRNIIVDPNQQILKLADFGCAKIVNPEIPNYPNVGTWQYRAVELLFGATHYSPKAGISFGDLIDIRHLVSRSCNFGDDVWKISIRSVL